MRSATTILALTLLTACNVQVSAPITVPAVPTPVASSVPVAPVIEAPVGEAPKAPLPYFEDTVTQGQIELDPRFGSHYNGDSAERFFGSITNIRVLPSKQSTMTYLVVDTVEGTLFALMPPCDQWSKFGTVLPTANTEPRDWYDTFGIQLPKVRLQYVGDRVEVTWASDADFGNQTIRARSSAMPGEITCDR